MSRQVARSIRREPKIPFAQQCTSSASIVRGWHCADPVPRSFTWNESIGTRSTASSTKCARSSAGSQSRMSGGSRKGCDRSRCRNFGICPNPHRLGRRHCKICAPSPTDCWRHKNRCLRTTLLAPAQAVPPPCERMRARRPAVRAANCRRARKGALGVSSRCRSTLSRPVAGSGNPFDQLVARLAGHDPLRHLVEPIGVVHRREELRKASPRAGAEALLRHQAQRLRQALAATLGNALKATLLRPTDPATAQLAPPTSCSLPPAYRPAQAMPQAPFGSPSPASTPRTPGRARCPTESEAGPATQPQPWQAPPATGSKLTTARIRLPTRKIVQANVAFVKHQRPLGRLERLQRRWSRPDQTPNLHLRRPRRIAVVQHHWQHWRPFTRSTQPVAAGQLGVEQRRVLQVPQRHQEILARLELQQHEQAWFAVATGNTPHAVPQTLLADLANVLRRQLLEALEIEPCDHLGVADGVQQVLHHAREREQAPVVAIVHAAKASERARRRMQEIAESGVSHRSFSV